MLKRELFFWYRWIFFVDELIDWLHMQFESEWGRFRHVEMENMSLFQGQLWKFHKFKWIQTSVRHPLAAARLSVWELHPCSIGGLWAPVAPVLFVYFSFFWLFSSFLSLLPSCRVLVRTSCCLVITVWLSSFSVPSCLAEVSCSLHSPAASTSSWLSPSWFCIAVFFSILFGVILWVCLLSCIFLFWLSDTPSPLPAMRSPMVQCCACLQFCCWSVGLSPVHVKLCQLVLCRGLSSEWTMCIKLHSFLVWHMIHSHIQNVKCHVEVMLLWNDFSSGNNLCGD